ncbi:MAG: TonB-dependent copper receptor [Oceanospirillales bacterium LUC14_002_19_P2]|nr:MAG: TonB-dependent copper receptor [Oceanospirillales bacterium LUC14_002_19_P2]
MGKYTPLALALSATLLQAHADTLLTIDVEAEPLPGESQLTVDGITTQSTTDAGALLRELPGATATRRGGKGFEPIIRGQQQNQLNVLSDGGYLFSACPGRMDPPTTYTTLAGYDTVTVIRGNRSVIYGGGGSGGTILLERTRPSFSEPAMQGTLTGGYTGNSDLKDFSADITAGNADGYLRLFGKYTSMDNYDDGSGNTVSSGYDSKGGGAVAGYQLTESTWAEVSLESVREEDIYYAGNGMDSPEANNDSWRLKLEQELESGFFESTELQLYGSDVEHRMDNFTVRDRNPSGMMGMLTDSTSDTRGGRLLGYASWGTSDITLGIDYLDNRRNAERYMVNKNSGAWMANALMWPDVRQQQTGLFVEADTALNTHNSLRTGLRIDHVNAEARAAHQTFGSNTPVDLYQTHYGTRDDSADETNLGAVVSWTHRYDKDSQLELAFSRSVRTADATERFIAAPGMSGNPDWVGNPDLKPEKHHQVEVTWQETMGMGQWSTTVFYNRVDDYINRYTDTGAILYDNVDARLYGLEGQLTSPLTEQWILTADIAWTRGRNHSDDRNLSQIAPLSGQLALDWQNGVWKAGVRWQLATNQNDIDENSGLDAGETAGYGVVHLHGSWQAHPSLLLSAGVENLLDKTYALHVNAASVDPFNPDAIRVNEPGRQVWVKAKWQF